MCLMLSVCTVVQEIFILKFKCQRNILLLMLCAVILLALSGPACAKDDVKSWLIGRFDSLDLAINNGDGYGKYSNEDGTLAWAESYLLEAYLDMYEATGKTDYLKKFVVQSKRVYDSTDKARKIQDYKGRIRTGWNSVKYSKNHEPMVHVVNTGMILRPMLRFSLLVKDNKGLAEYADISAKYVKLAEDALYEIEGQWRFDVRSGQGSYWFEGDEPMQADLTAPMPFNGQLAIGRVVILLYRLTGKDSHLLKARGLARLFKDNLSLTGMGAYKWGYRPDIGKYRKPEDISHGAIDVDFTVDAYRADIVFTKDDLKGFSKTLLNIKKDSGFHFYVDGTDDKDEKTWQNDAVGRWLELSEVDCDIYHTVYDYIAARVKNSKKEHPQVLSGIAKLVRHYNDCNGK